MRAVPRARSIQDAIGEKRTSTGTPDTFAIASAIFTAIFDFILILILILLTITIGIRITIAAEDQPCSTARFARYIRASACSSISPIDVGFSGSNSTMP